VYTQDKMPPNEPTLLNYEVVDNTKLESKLSFNDKKEEEDCRNVVDSLTEEELEEAANASYAYYMSVVVNDKNISDDIHLSRYQMAMKMARQHLIAEKHDIDKALVRMRKALTFRKEHKLNELRSCFSTTPSNTDGDDESNNIETLKSQIVEETSRQLMFVRGYTKEKQAILIKQDRTAPVTDEKAYFNTNIYMLERAIACTEHASKGTQHKIVVVLNYTNYIRANVPPMRLMKEFITIMESYYPDNLASLILVDVPFYFKGVWYFLKPFMDPNNTEKIKFVTGDEQREEILGPLIDEDQAMPFLLPNGKLSSDIDIMHFLNDVPFHCDYDNK